MIGTFFLVLVYCAIIIEQIGRLLGCLYVFNASEYLFVHILGGIYLIIYLV